VIQGPAPELGDTVLGKIDWGRRLDNLQQHTGQHILSAAFIKLFEAPTLSFRVLEHECEIDVALENPTDERIEQAVDLANQIIWEGRSITIRQVTSDEAAALPLRKEPAREGELRLIEISDFDLTPCGGTHARSTGEVGVIAVRSWERAKGLSRIHFMAGVRVLADYRKANETARQVAALFSAGREDSPALVTRLVEDNKKLRRRVSELELVACRIEAEELLGGGSETMGAGPSSKVPSEDPVGLRVITRVFADRDADSLKHLALAIIAYPNTVALLGSRDGDTARLVFARSGETESDMNLLMRAACKTIDGRGGGRPDFAQGGGKNLEQLTQAIESAAAGLQRQET
jgi:alanyl-tRNA synthetase